MHQVTSWPIILPFPFVGCQSRIDPPEGEEHRLSNPTTFLVTSIFGKMSSLSIWRKFQERQHAGKASDLRGMPAAMGIGERSLFDAEFVLNMRQMKVVKVTPKIEISVATPLRSEAFGKCAYVKLPQCR